MCNYRLNRAFKFFKGIYIIFKFCTCTGTVDNTWLGVNVCPPMVIVVFGLSSTIMARAYMPPALLALMVNVQVFYLQKL